MLILDNRKARFDYHIGDVIQVGIVLEGWEVKSIRDHRLTMPAGYVIIRDGELWLTGLTITPLNSASTPVTAVKDRTRKLLAKRKEIDRLIGSIDQKGYTIVPVSLVWHNGVVKVNIALAKGKSHSDKRHSEHDKDVSREIDRMLKNKGR